MGDAAIEAELFGTDAKDVAIEAELFGTWRARLTAEISEIVHASSDLDSLSLKQVYVELQSRLHLDLSDFDEAFKNEIRQVVTDRIQELTSATDERCEREEGSKRRRLCDENADPQMAFAVDSARGASKKEKKEEKEKKETEEKEEKNEQRQMASAGGGAIAGKKKKKRKEGKAGKEGKTTA